MSERHEAKNELGVYPFYFESVRPQVNVTGQGSSAKRGVQLGWSDKLPSIETEFCVGHRAL